MATKETKSELLESTSSSNQEKRKFSYIWILVILLILCLILLIIFFCPQDKTPPVISELQAVNITASSTEITWITDEPADGLVNFGTSPSTPTGTAIANIDMALNHAAKISALKASTTYYYFVTSTDKSDNTATSSLQTFITAPWPPPESRWQNVEVDFVPWSPSIAWNGSAYGLVAAGKSNTTTNPELFFTLLDTHGNKQIGDVRLTYRDHVRPNAVFIGSPQIVWNGNGYGFLWSGNDGSSDKTNFVLLNATGTRVSTDTILGSGAAGGGYRDSLIWTGSDYAAGWRANFSRMAADGDEILTKVGIFSGGVFQNPSVVWDGENYGVTWSAGQNQRDIYFNRINTQGVKLLADSVIAKVSTSTTPRISAGNPLIFWDEPNYIVIWEQASNDEDIDGIYYAKVNRVGHVVVFNRKISTTRGSNRRPAGVKNGDTYAIAWTNISSDNRQQLIYFKTIDLFGNTITGDEVISAVLGYNDNVDIEWNGANYGAVWSNWFNMPGEQARLYFAVSPDAL